MPSPTIACVINQLAELVQMSILLPIVLSMPQPLPHPPTIATVISVSMPIPLLVLPSIPTFCILYSHHRIVLINSNSSEDSIALMRFLSVHHASVRTRTSALHQPMRIQASSFCQILVALCSCTPVEYTNKKSVPKLNFLETYQRPTTLQNTDDIMSRARLQDH